MVFVSYSHDDAQWAQWFRKMLKPVVCRKRLELWDDTGIRVGDEWHPAIDRAIQRSSVALLLVSRSSPGVSTAPIPQYLSRST